LQEKRGQPVSLLELLLHLRLQILKPESQLEKNVYFPFPCHFFYCMQQLVISVQSCRPSCEPIISVQLGWSAIDRLLHSLFHQRLDDRLFWMIGCNQVRLMDCRNLLSGRFRILILKT
jgi:hypothetical protein